VTNADPQLESDHDRRLHGVMAGLDRVHISAGEKIRMGMFTIPVSPVLLMLGT